MKNILIIVCLFLSMNSLGQITTFKNVPKDILEDLGEMGVDESSVLNQCESEYFNVIFQCIRKDFDFTDKKIGFILRGGRSNKKEYFDKERDRFSRNYSPNVGTLYVFDENQKKESGGYDAAIVYWSKVLLPAKDVVKRLKGNSLND